MPASPTQAVSPVPCPRALHVDAKVIAKGTRTTTDGVRQRYLCRMPGGDTHTFSVLITARGTPVPLYSPPPDCGEHAGSKVVRVGTYARSSTQQRQRYRCIPVEGAGRGHDFTPPLARARVHTGHDSCAECDELRGTHRGEEAAARRHSWTLRQVAAGLKALSEGQSYSRVSRDAWEATNRSRTRKKPDTTGGAKPTKPTKPAKKSYKVSRGSRLARNCWHTAADWCEAFSPVLWEHVVAQLRTAELAQRAENDALLEAGGALGKPMVLLLDDLPINTGHHKGTGNRDWFALAAAQVVWHEVPSEDAAITYEASTRLRLLRAVPTNSNEAWRLLLDELGYAPDYIVADGGTGLVKAVKDHYAGTVPLIPSLYHVRNNVIDALVRTPGAWVNTEHGKRPLDDLAEHLLTLRKKGLTGLSVKDWGTWWDDLIAKLTAHRLPVEPALRQRRTYEGVVAAVLPHINTYPQLPLATGGLETLIRERVEPVLVHRGRSFGNVERTNCLLDLAVCRDHGMFLDLTPLIALLREDNAAAHGWATELRAVSDLHPVDTTVPIRAGRRPVRILYSSLRDTALLLDRARKAGLR